MSSKSHPGDGTRHQGEKGGNVGYVSHPTTTILGWSIFKHVRQLWHIVKQ